MAGAAAHAERRLGPAPLLVCDDPVHEMPEVDGLRGQHQVAALDPAEDEQVVDQPVEPVRLERDVVNELRVARLEGRRPAEEP